MNGLHLLGDFYRCRCDPVYLSDALTLRDVCVRQCREAELTVLGDHFHQFENGGVTGTVILAESHLAIHTWPETGSVTIDVYVCNYSQDNRSKARRLFEEMLKLLAPEKNISKSVERGTVPQRLRMVRG